MNNEVTFHLRMADVLFREGDQPTTAFLLESGRLRITARSDDGERLLAEIGPGELVGEMAVIDQSPRTATATAISDCVLLAIDAAQISERLTNTDPIVRALLEGQLRRYRATLATIQGQQSESENPYQNAPLGIHKIRLESALRESLRNDGLDLRLQPLMDVITGSIAGFEALVRWQHPERGAISPAEFIALAEETSLIEPVGDYVTRRALDALVDLRAQGVADLPFIAINVSARQMSRVNLVEQLLDELRERQLPPSALKLEITESLQLDYAQVASVMAVAQRNGIRVALDDFGTGYSNLQHMHLLPFNTLKVDQSLARGMVDNARTRILLRSIVQMARDLEADVVVEGIETDAELNVLRQLGVHYAQGWLVGRPEPVDVAIRQYCAGHSAIRS
ncbi:MAG: EAL domain-containing protein [Lysobacteraceae bacterium]